MAGITLSNKAEGILQKLSEGEHIASWLSDNESDDEGILIKRGFITREITGTWGFGGYELRLTIKGEDYFRPELFD